MANGNPKKGGGGGGRDVVMESRHLIGVFLGVVVLCCVFFTLGYVMGRTQYDTSVRAAIATKHDAPPAAPAKTDATPSAPIPTPSEWTFPNSSEAKKTTEPLKPLASKPSAEIKPATPSPSNSAGAAKTAAKSAPAPLWKAPNIPRGAIVLQVAALTRQGDALALADVLQKKEFPAFVLTPSGDNLYRVQVGPYADASSAESARRSLEREGFKAISKH